MTHRDIILKELRDLQSSLENANAGEVYQVPVGYFDNLVKQLVQRIKAIEAGTVDEELRYLSPFMSNLSKKQLYTVPAGYFDGLAESIIVAQKDTLNKTSAEEIEELSPLLSSLKNQTSYRVPQGYFEDIAVVAKETKPAKVVSIGKKWFRYAAAAAITGLVATSAFFIFKNGNRNTDPDNRTVKQLIKNVSTDEINKFVQLTDETSHDVAVVEDPKSKNKDKSDIQELVKDIPDKDIQKFIDDTRVAESDNMDDDVLMN